MATIAQSRRNVGAALVFLLGAAVFLNYVDRGAIGIAAPKMKDELGLSAEAYGMAFVEHAIVLPQKENPVVRSFWDWLGRLNSVVSACKTAYAAGQIASDAVFRALDYFK